MRYSPAVERHFTQPSNLGPLAIAAGSSSGRSYIFRGEAGAAARGTWVVVEAEICAGVAKRIAFQAYGCPHLIAACSLATERMAGGPAAELAAFDPAGLMGDLDVPAQKLGSLLILQDALRSCWADWDTTQLA